MVSNVLTPGKCVGTGFVYKKGDLAFEASCVVVIKYFKMPKNLIWREA